MKQVFIDGSAGTTGLRLYDRLKSRSDIALLTLCDADRKNPEKRRQALNDCDVAVLCLPDDAAREAVAMVENEKVILLDASTAHRTEPDWAYGFPELSAAHREKLLNAKRIAVPGCHAGGFIALVYPLVAAGVLPESALLSCFSLTGYSGGGKKMIADYEAPNRNALLSAPRQYGLTQTHKHLREMQKLTGLAHAPVFCPIVGDFYSGMEVTVPLHAAQLSVGIDALRELYQAAYPGGLVSYREAVGEDGFCSALALSGKDTMEVSVAGNADRIALIARYDNLGKGASGAALQCLNLVLGCPEDSGLSI